MATASESSETINALRRYLQKALEQNPAERPAFLLKNSSDPFERAEVERLFTEHDQAGAFLSTPVLDKISIAARAPSPRLSEGEALAGRFRLCVLSLAGAWAQSWKYSDSTLSPHLSSPQCETKHENHAEKEQYGESPNYGPERRRGRFWQSPPSGPSFLRSWRYLVFDFLSYRKPEGLRVNDLSVASSV